MRELRYKELDTLTKEELCERALNLMDEIDRLRGELGTYAELYGTLVRIVDKYHKTFGKWWWELDEN